MDSVRQNKIARLLQKELATFFTAESRYLFPGQCGGPAGVVSAEPQHEPGVRA